MTDEQPIVERVETVPQPPADRPASGFSTGTEAPSDDEREDPLLPSGLPSTAPWQHDAEPARSAQQQWDDAAAQAESDQTT